MPTHICVDMHVHLGQSRDGSKLMWPEIEKLMDENAIDYAVLFPIDVKDPGPSYANINTEIIRVAKKNKRAIGFCRLNPKEPRAALQELSRAVKNGMRGIKMHPRAEDFSSAGVDDIFAAIEKDGVINGIFIHELFNFRPH